MKQGAGRWFSTHLRWFVRQGAARYALAAASRQGNLTARILYDQETQVNPFPLHDHIRDQGPLVGGKWATTTARFSCSQEILRNKRLNASATSSRLASWALEHTHDADAVGPLDQPSLLVVDPPDHTRYRRLVSQVFTARAVETVRPKVQRIVDDLLDEMAQHEEVDLVERFAKRLPVAVIAHMMGIPEHMLGQFLDWSERAVPALDLGLNYPDFMVADAALRETNAWLVEHFQRLRRQPGDDLLSYLVQLADGGERLNDAELLATVQLLLAAGFVTIVDMLASGAVLLARHPDQLKILLDDPHGWANAVEEILRFDSPVQVTARFAAEPTRACGTEVLKGQAILVFLGGANRDPAEFPDPNVFDVTRANARDHLAFSRGIHHCLGSGLARLEGEIGLRALFERFPDLELVGPPARRPGSVLRGYQSVTVRLNGSNR
jgi:cytochrome P450